jgi:hypothetical protein
LTSRRAALGYFDVVVCNVGPVQDVPDPEGMLDDIPRPAAAGGNLLPSIFGGIRPTWGCDRMLDARFELVDAVSARNLTDDETGRTKQCWRVSSDTGAAS